MRLADRFRRLDDRVLGPPPLRPRRGLYSPAALGWAAVGFVGSIVTRTTWGLILFIALGVVGMFTAGLLTTRRTLGATVVANEMPVTVDKHDPVRDWLARRNQRVRSALVFAARFPFVAAPAIGAAIGFGISNQRNCVTYRNSDRCSFYIPGHHTVVGGAGWGLAIAVVAYAGALLVRGALLRADAAAQEAAARAVEVPSTADAPAELTRLGGSESDPDFVVVRSFRQQRR